MTTIAPLTVLTVARIGMKRKEKEKTTAFGVSLMRSQVLYQAAQGQNRNSSSIYCDNGNDGDDNGNSNNTSVER